MERNLSKECWSRALDIQDVLIAEQNILLFAGAVGSFHATKPQGMLLNVNGVGRKEL